MDWRVVNIQKDIQETETILLLQTLLRWVNIHNTDMSNHISLEFEFLIIDVCMDDEDGHCVHKMSTSWRTRGVSVQWHCIYWTEEGQLVRFEFMFNVVTPHLSPDEATGAQTGVLVDHRFKLLITQVMPVNSARLPLW